MGISQTMNCMSDLGKDGNTVTVSELKTPRPCAKLNMVQTRTRTRKDVLSPKNKLASYTHTHTPQGRGRVAGASKEIREMPYQKGRVVLT